MEKGSEVLVAASNFEAAKVAWQLHKHSLHQHQTTPEDPIEKGHDIKVFAVF
jgi:hypothetical protein